MADTTRQDPLDGLTLEETRIVELTLLGDGCYKIAEKLGCSHTHANRVVNKPHVKAMLNELKEAAIEGLRRVAVRAGSTAIATLISVAQDKGAPAAARVSAASKLADIAIPRRTEVTGREGGPVAVDMQTDVERIRSTAAKLSAADLGLTPDPAVPDRGAYDEG
jgi:hypothetical protein